MQQPKLAKVGKVQQVLDGKTYRIHKRKNGSFVTYTICCDCGLTHLEEFKVRKNFISAKAWRVEKMTKQFRGKRRIVGTKRGN